MTLQTVSSAITLSGMIRKECAWNIISNFSLYPTIMENVESVKVVEKNDTTGISEWSINIDNAPLTWIEKDIYNKDSFSLNFKLVDGDFDQLEGKWEIDDTDSTSDGIIIRFEISYNLGIPVIEETLGEILKEKMQQNIEGMLQAVSQQISDINVDERKHKRHMILKDYSISINNINHDVKIIDFSSGGLRIKCENKIPEQVGDLQIHSKSLNNVQIIPEVSNTFRILFSKHLPFNETEKLAYILSHRKTQTQTIFVIKKNEITKKYDV